MTYKLNPEIGKIHSPVVIIFPDGSRSDYSSGLAVVDAVFDKRYMISRLKAVDNKIEIIIKEPNIFSSNWIGEEQTFF